MAIIGVPSVVEQEQRIAELEKELAEARANDKWCLATLSKWFDDMDPEAALYIEYEPLEQISERLQRNESA